MYSAQRKSNEQYTILRSRLHYKKTTPCHACHAPVHRAEAVCPWCGAERTKPVTGVTQRLPTLPVPAAWYRHSMPLTIGLLLTLLQTRAWLWLWPLPQIAATNRGGEAHINMFYYAAVFAVGATICLHYRLRLRAAIALLGLVICWLIRAFMA